MLQIDSSERERLLYRRQFVLTQETWSSPKGWNKLELKQLGTLWTHPELEVSHGSNGGIAVTCLGFIIDPDAPGTTTQQTLDKLVEGLNSSRDVFKLSASFGGRWALLVEELNERIIFGDPCGFRQVFYTHASAPQLWCASQAARISEALRLQRTHAELDFFRSHPEPWWPGDSTPWKQIKVLLPNHFLNLVDRSVSRFWPVDLILKGSMEDITESGANYLSALVNSTHSLFSLALPITAGIDSRSILAAMRTIANDVFFYTLLFDEAGWKGADLVVPTRLLRKLGLRHHIIRCPDVMDSQLRDLHQGNTETLDLSAGIILEGLYEAFPQDRVSVSGLSGEIARCFYRKKGDESEPSSLDLAKRVGMDPTPFVLGELEAYLADARGPADSCGIDIWDLFYWEQRVGRWGADAQATRDLIHESFTPFNCRKLLETLLGVPGKFRHGPDYELYREMIWLLWPKVLSEPINPSIVTLSERLRSSRIGRYLGRLIR